MPEMVSFEQGFCRSAPWRWVARKLALPWALQGEQLSGDVLEIGSGSGAMAAELLRTFPGVRLTATDYDEAMMSTARERLAGFGNRATAQRADATKLPFPDASFDSVLSFIMLHHVIDWEGALREATRVLRPGGRLIGYDLLSSPLLRLFHQLEGSGPRTRMMHFNELRHALREIPVVGTARRSLGGITVRFDLAKQVTKPNDMPSS